LRTYKVLAGTPAPEPEAEADELALDAEADMSTMNTSGKDARLQYRQSVLRQCRECPLQIPSIKSLVFIPEMYTQPIFNVT